MSDSPGGTPEPGLAPALAMLAELVAHLASAGTVAQVATLLASQAKWVVPCSSCSLLLLEEERWHVEPGGARGPREALTGPVALALERALPVTLPGPAGPLPPPGAGAPVFSPTARAVMVLPLEADGKVFGTLNLSADSPELLSARPGSVYRLLQLNLAAVLHAVRLRDHAERARAEAEAATRQREELMALVAHDLRNPLGAIQAAAQLLAHKLARSGGLDPASLRSGLQRIERQTRRMTDLVEELLDAARLSAGQQLDLHLAPTDLVSLVRESILDHQDLSQCHRLVLEVQAPELVGHWDARRLKSVLANLLSNAIKYSPAGGDVTVRVHAEQTPGSSAALLEVTDRGMGIPTADLPFLFERFFRASNVVTRTVGIGIGLHGAHRIVLQHGGTLTVRSEEGRGTTMVVRLPMDVRAEPPRGSPHAHGEQAAAPPPGHPPRVGATRRSCEMPHRVRPAGVHSHASRAPALLPHMTPVPRRRAR